jgi:hypothetical protein
MENQNKILLLKITIGQKNLNQYIDIATKGATYLSRLPVGIELLDVSQESTKLRI